MKRRKLTLRQKQSAGRGTKLKRSNYARKREYLVKHGGFGFEYAEPKPWK